MMPRYVGHFMLFVVDSVRFVSSIYAMYQSYFILHLQIVPLLFYRPRFLSCLYFAKEIALPDSEERLQFDFASRSLMQDSQL